MTKKTKITQVRPGHYILVGCNGETASLIRTVHLTGRKEWILTEKHAEKLSSRRQFFSRTKQDAVGIFTHELVGTCLTQ